MLACRTVVQERLGVRRVCRGVEAMAAHREGETALRWEGGEVKQGQAEYPNGEVDRGGRSDSR